MEALLNKLEDYGFECEAGTLKNSQHWIELRAALASAPTRQELQSEGKHPTPCATYCEANAFAIEIRALKSQLASAPSESIIKESELTTCRHCGFRVKLNESPQNEMPSEQDVHVLKEQLLIAQQGFAEVQHAINVGPSWYTRGESGMYSQVSMWVEKGESAINAALASSEQDKLDAQRLDFIEKQGNDFSWGVRQHTEPIGSYVIEFGSGLSVDGTSFRGAIDAAIKKGEV